MLDVSEVDAIRDAARALKDADSRLSYRLFRLAFLCRPGGPYIASNYKELKQSLGIKSFVVIGNCQAEIIASLLREKNPTIEIDLVVVAHLYKHASDDIYKRLDLVDYIVTQNISDAFSGISTSLLESKYKDKLIKIPNVFFSDYHPDWTYLPTVGGVRCQSPIGDYHCRTLVTSFLEGLSVDDAICRMYSPDYAVSTYANAAQNSIEELIERERHLDVVVSDIVWSDYLRGVCRFHTFNHPSRSPLNELVGRILDFAGLPNIEPDTQGENLDKVVFGVSKNVIGMTDGALLVNGAEVDIRDFSERSYATYWRNPLHLDAYRKRHWK